MRQLFVAAVLSLLATFAGALSLHATNAVLAIASVAAITVFVTWLSAQHSTDDESGLALANPAWMIGLSITGRYAPANLIPTFAAQVVGAVLAGLAVLGLQSRLPDAMVWSPPSLISAGAVCLILGIVGIWLLFAIDQQLSEPYAAIGPLLAGGCLPVGLISALNPAVVLGMATAEQVTWPVAGTVVASVVVASIIGSLLGPAVSPENP